MTAFVTLNASLCLLIILSSLLLQSNAQPLSEYISHYETVSYGVPSPRIKAYSSNRVKRSQSQEENVIDIAFNAFGRHFPLRLHRDYRSVFRKDLVIES